ncbi:MAG: hypothetical protein QNL17_02170, partial [Synechococcus sp. ChSW.bin.154]
MANNSAINIGISNAPWEEFAAEFSQRLQIHEKTAWMLRSLLENQPSLQTGADSKLKGDRPIGKSQQFSAH